MSAYRVCRKCFEPHGSERGCPQCSYRSVEELVASMGCPEVEEEYKRLSKKRVAALYVQRGGAYFGLPHVDPWDEKRDARSYAGPLPVVAHPPCQRWSRFWAGQPGAVKRGKREKLGDDQGKFASALWAVRTFGGVLEHPANSKAWPWYGLVKPPREGGWVKADEFGGWTCRVEQGRYGHFAAKPTWLYATGVELPELEWGVRPKTTEADFPPEAIAKHGLKYCQRAGVLAFKGGGKDSTPRIHTPEPFRDLLLGMAMSANVEAQAPPEGK